MTFNTCECDCRPESGSTDTSIGLEIFWQKPDYNPLTADIAKNTLTLMYRSVCTRPLCLLAVAPTKYCPDKLPPLKYTASTA